jgi:hypothetical protein
LRYDGSKASESGGYRLLSELWRLVIVQFYVRCHTSEQNRQSSKRILLAQVRKNQQTTSECQNIVLSASCLCEKTRDFRKEHTAGVDEHKGLKKHQVELGLTTSLGSNNHSTLVTVNGFIIKTGGGRVFKLLTSSKLLITRVY